MAKTIVTTLDGRGRENGYVSVIIAKTAEGEAGLVSGIADLGGFAVLGLLIPTLDSANLTFQVSNLSTGTFYTVKDKGGATALTITAGTGDWAVESGDLDDLKGYRFVKIVASAAQVTAARTLIWVCKG